MDNSVIYNRIYARSLEWGSKWRKPVIEIVKEEYPTLTDAEQEQISKSGNILRDQISFQYILPLD